MLCLSRIPQSVKRVLGNALLFRFLLAESDSLLSVPNDVWHIWNIVGVKSRFLLSVVLIQVIRSDLCLMLALKR